MLRLLGVVVVAAVITLFAVALLLEVNTGPTVVTLVPERGLHERDLYVLSGWAVGMLGLGTALLPRSGRGRRRS